MIQGPLTDDAMIIVEAPLSEGGWGLPCPSSSAPIAFVSSLLRATLATDNFNHIRLPRNASDRIDESTLIPSVQECLLHLRSMKSDLNDSKLDNQTLPYVDFDSGLLRLPAQVSSHHKLQHRINNALSLKRIKVASLNNPFLATRFEELCSPYSRLFHHILPTSEKLTFTDWEYCLAARHLLNLPPADNLPKSCFCGELLSNKPDHFHSCRQTRNTLINRKHNFVRDTIALLTGMVGCEYQREVQVSAEDARRVDGMCFLSSGSYSHDVSGIHTNSPSYVRSNLSLSQLCSARDSKKNALYLEEEARNGHTFSSFVFTSCGALNKSAVALLSRLASEADKTGIYSETDFFKTAVFMILVAIHKSNARISKIGTMWARKASFPVSTSSHASRRRSGPPSITPPVSSPLAVSTFLTNCIASAPSSALPSPLPVIEPFSSQATSTIPCVLCSDHFPIEEFSFLLIGCSCSDRNICYDCAHKSVLIHASKCPCCNQEVTAISCKDDASNFIPVPTLQRNIVRSDLDEQAIETLLRNDADDENL